MPEFLFVGDLPEDGLQIQNCRSHAARISHLRRKQKLGYMTRSSLRSTVLLPPYCALQATPQYPQYQHPKNVPSDQNFYPNDSLPRWLKPTVSTYLRETYPASSLGQISSLLEYLFLHHGPIYVWRSLIDDREQASFQTLVVTGLLGEPVIVEPFLALLRSQRDKASMSQDPRRASQAVLEHQGRALALLHNRLSMSSPDVKFQSFTFWAIVLNILVNHTTGDWKSFTANLQGLRQLVSLLGGNQKLSMEEPRAAIYVQQLESTYTNYLKSLSHEPAEPPSTAADTAKSTHSAAAQELSYSTPYPASSVSELFGEFASLHISGRLDLDVATLLSECSRHLSRCEHTHDANLMLHDGQFLASKLLTALKRSKSQTAEFVLCCGMLTLFMSEQGSMNVDNEQWCEGQLLLSNNTIVKLNRTWAKVDVQKEPLDIAIWMTKYLLWTALIVATMPSRIFPDLVEQHFLLKHLVSTRRRDMPFSWDSVRGFLGGFYINKSLAAR